MASVPTAPVVHPSGQAGLAPASYVPESGNGVTAAAASSESIRQFYADRAQRTATTFCRTR